MKFCEKCGNILVIKNENGQNYLFCRVCNDKQATNEELIISFNVNSPDKGIEIEENLKQESEFPTTKIDCPKCQNTEAYWTMQQMRSADEPPTIFYRCTSCSHTWRSYG